jgi:hypothetical protein
MTGNNVLTKMQHKAPTQTPPVLHIRKHDRSLQAKKGIIGKLKMNEKPNNAFILR